MKKIVTSVILSLSLLMQTNVMAARQPLDHIVAVVNDEVITQREFNQAYVTIKNQLAHSPYGVPAKDKLQKQVLDQLIDRKLQLQIAKQASIAISDEELTQTIKTIASDNHISVQALFNKVKQEGMSVTKYRDEIKDQLTIQKLQQREFAASVTISPKEIDNFLRNQHLTDTREKSYHVIDYLIPVAENASSTNINNAKIGAHKLITALGQNKSTQPFAKSYQLQNNDLGWRKLSELPSAFTAPVAQLSVNGIAGPIQTGNGYHILRLVAEKRIGQGVPALTRKQAERFVFQQKFAEAAQTWVSKLRNQAFIMTDINDGA
jgi:peptidyl-prolyl cis-trans isomerase SurA